MHGKSTTQGCNAMNRHPSRNRVKTPQAGKDRAGKDGDRWRGFVTTVAGRCLLKSLPLLKSDEIASRSTPRSDFAHGFHRLLSSDGALRPRASRSRRTVTAIPFCSNVLAPLDAAALPKHLLVCACGRKDDARVQVVRCIASIVPKARPVSFPVLVRRLASTSAQEASLHRQYC
jgi:hypothetical protein